MPASVFVEREEFLEKHSRDVPRLCRMQFRDKDHLRQVIWERTLSPIMHEQQKISPVLHSAQMRSISEVITDVERHPNIRLGLYSHWSLADLNIIVAA